MLTNLHKASICFSKIKSRGTPLSLFACYGPVRTTTYTFFDGAGTCNVRCISNTTSGITVSGLENGHYKSKRRKSISQAFSVDADDIPLPVPPVAVAMDSTERNYHHNENTQRNTSSIIQTDYVTEYDAITPISALDIATPNSWTIQAMVVSKSEIRTWSNQRSEGTLFRIKLVDSSGVDIMAAFFNIAVNKFYNQLEISKVYKFTGGRLKFANPTFNECKSAYEFTFNELSKITHQPDVEIVSNLLLKEEDEHQPQVDYMTIPEINQVTDIGGKQNVLAIVKTVGPLERFTSSNTGKKYTKCELLLVDDSDTEISLVLWAERAERAAEEFAGNPVVAIKNTKISDWRPDAYNVIRSLSSASNIEINPIERIPKARELADWWKMHKKDDIENSKTAQQNYPDVPF